MPQPNSNTPYNNSHNHPNSAAPVGVPFGAGWIAPSQHPTQQHSSPQHVPQQNSLHYQPLSTHHQTPYPPTSNISHAPQHHAPYPPINSPSNAPYPGSSYPHNPQHAQAPYPFAAGTPTYGTSGGGGHSPHYTHPPTHPSYAPTHGYTPVPTSVGYESPAGNIAHCFQELAHLKGHMLQHHQPFAPKEVCVRSATSLYV